MRVSKAVVKGYVGLSIPLFQLAVVLACCHPPTEILNMYQSVI